MGIMQNPMISIGDMRLFRGMAARRDPFPDRFLTDCSPLKLASTVFMKISDA